MFPGQTINVSKKKKLDKNPYDIFRKPQSFSETVLNLQKKFLKVCFLIHKGSRTYPYWSGNRVKRETLTSAYALTIVIIFNVSPYFLPCILLTL